MNENVKSVKGNRTYKDTVFRMLFREKKELLSLYNAMNGSDFHLYLYEHQSTVNSNMPLRFLQYVAKEYEKLIGGDTCEYI